MFKKKKKIEKICGNCLLYNHQKGECKVATFVEGMELHMPVFPNDKCHLEELGIEVKQVRWFVEDENGKPTNGNGTVKIEYPIDFFGKETKEGKI